MTSPGGMSCETCQDLLIELVCDELAVDQAAAVRAHALKCERCGPELEKLSFTLKASSSLGLMSPSPEVERRIMQAAREAIAGRARGPAREAAAQAASYGGIADWFARLVSFAMSPQVAMASVLLLVVGIGLYALPLGPRNAPEQTALRAAEEESDEQGAAPSGAASATAAPLERPEPSAAPRAAEEMAGSGALERRNRGGDLELKKGAEAAKEIGALGSARARKAAAPSQPADALSESKDRSAAAFPGMKSSAGPAAAKPKAASKALGELADDFGAPAMQASGGGGASPAKREGSAQSAAASNQYAPAPPAAPMAKSPRAVPAEAPARSQKVAPEAEKAAAEVMRDSADKRAKSDGASALEQGIAAIKRGDHAQGQALLKPVASSGTGSDRTTAMLWLARSLRERGDCAAALTYYKTLTQPVTAARALLEEAADCQARTGNAAAAERLRARAATPAKE